MPVGIMLIVGVVFLLAVAHALDLTARDRRKKDEASREPLCRYCGYDLTGNESGVCPECGTKVGSGPGEPMN